MEYAEAVRGRYLTAGKIEKGKILDEFCKTTGFNRKSAIRLLNREVRRGKENRGRRRQYGLSVVHALKKVWEGSGRICSKRLKPFLPKLLAALERHKEIDLPAGIGEQLVRLSPASIDRLLKPYRERGLRRPYSQSPSSATLKARIPIRTFGEWKDVTPGSLQGDLVSHCGESTAGFYLTTLCTVDVATGWSGFEAVWGKSQKRVGTGMHLIRQRLPFRLRELHTDNGGEFINEVLYPWCQREGIKFTRGRPYKKNDQAYVEQKNWSGVRRSVGYDRYETKAAYDQLAKVYRPLELFVNFFQPTRKLIGKERVGAKVRKVFDEAKTPYERAVETGVLEEAKARELAKLYESLNPIELQAQIEANLEGLWKLAMRGSMDSKTVEAIDRSVG